jgi:hypothetical protein
MGFPRTITRFCLIVLTALVIALMTGWASLAIYYSNLTDAWLRAALAILFPVLTLCAFAFLRNRRRTLVGFLVVFCAVTVWWAMIPASNDRDWRPEVAVLPYATVNGDLVTIHNIRNLDYRTETDFQPRYYDKTFDLSKLDSLDLITVYWMGDAIAHVMMSFGFGGKDFVAFSIETRMEKGKGYSTIKGFFKQFEITYIAGDERDLIRVRTDYRNPREDVYIFRTRARPERARLLFMEYVKEINRLKEKPEFYNTLTTNCATSVVHLLRAFGVDIRYSWKVLLSGYLARYVYDLGGLDSSLPFEELKRRGHVNPRANAVGNDPDFSRKIREGLPVPAKRP